MLVSLSSDGELRTPPSKNRAPNHMILCGSRSSSPIGPAAHGRRRESCCATVARAQPLPRLTRYSRWFNAKLVCSRRTEALSRSSDLSWALAMTGCGACPMAPDKLVIEGSDRGSGGSDRPCPHPPVIHGPSHLDGYPHPDKKLPTPTLWLADKRAYSLHCARRRPAAWSLRRECRHRRAGLEQLAAVGTIAAMRSRRMRYGALCDAGPFALLRR